MRDWRSRVLAAGVVDGRDGPGVADLARLVEQQVLVLPVHHHKAHPHVPCAWLGSRFQCQTYTTYLA